VSSSRTTVEVAATPAATFAYLADETNAAAWHPGVADAVRLDSGPLGPGARFQVVLSFYGKRIDTECVLEVYEPDRRIEFVLTGKSLTGRDVFTIEPDASGGSSVAYESTFKLKGWLKALDRGLQVAFDGVVQRGGEGLRKALSN
jgi:carbon monoxide dehydrogenase subunit G